MCPSSFAILFRHESPRFFCLPSPSILSFAFTLLPALFLSFTRVTFATSLATPRMLFALPTSFWPARQLQLLCLLFCLSCPCLIAWVQVLLILSFRPFPHCLPGLQQVWQLLPTFSFFPLVSSTGPWRGPWLRDLPYRPPHSQQQLVFLIPDSSWMLITNKRI